MFIPSQVSVSMFMSMPMCASVAMPLYVAVLLSLFKPGAFVVLFSCSLFTFTFTFVFLFRFPSVAFPQSFSFTVHMSCRFPDKSPHQNSPHYILPHGQFGPSTTRPMGISPHGKFAPGHLPHGHFAAMIELNETLYKNKNL
jgi:hypothetical protein